MTSHAGRARFDPGAPSGGATGSPDIGLVSAAGALELVLTEAYGALLGLAQLSGPGANPFVLEVLRTTAAQHAAHLQAVQATLAALGGNPVREPAPTYAGLLDQTLAAARAQPQAKALAAALGLLLELEGAAAQTYVRAAGLATEAATRGVCASVMGIEAQHVVVFEAITTLLDAGDPGLVSLPPDTGALPASVGSAPIPHAFYPTTAALAPPSGS